MSKATQEFQDKHGISGSLLNVALEVHMNAMGSVYDDLSNEQLDLRVELLSLALESWVEPSSDFDSSVQELIAEALSEYYQHIGWSFGDEITELFEECDSRDFAAVLIDLGGYQNDEIDKHIQHIHPCIFALYSPELTSKLVAELMSRGFRKVGQAPKFKAGDLVEGWPGPPHANAIVIGVDNPNEVLTIALCNGNRHVLVAEQRDRLKVVGRATANDWNNLLINSESVSSEIRLAWIDSEAESE